jgi:hypothetical protein
MSEAITEAIEHPKCVLCGANGALDSEVILCVSSSTWVLSWKSTHKVRMRAPDGREWVEEKTENHAREYHQTTDPKEWPVRLCGDCQVAKYIEIAHQKQKQNAKHIVGTCIAGIVGGVIVGSFWLWGQGSGAPPQSFEQVDQRLSREGGNWILAIVVLLAAVTVAVSVVMLPVLISACVRRVLLTRIVKRDRRVPSSQRPLSFSQAAKRILSKAESNALSVACEEFPLPAVPTAAECHIAPPQSEQSLEMKKHCRIIKVQYADGRWEDRDDRIW